MLGPQRRPAFRLATTPSKGPPCVALSSSTGIQTTQPTGETGCSTSQEERAKLHRIREAARREKKHPSFRSKGSGLFDFGRPADAHTGPRGSGAPASWTSVNANPFDDGDSFLHHDQRLTPLLLPATCPASASHGDGPVLERTERRSQAGRDRQTTPRETDQLVGPSTLAFRSASNALTCPGDRGSSWLMRTASSTWSMAPKPMIADVISGSDNTYLKAA